MERPELSRRRVQGDALLELTERRKLDPGDERFPAAGGLVVRYVEPDEADEKEARAARRAVAAFRAALGGPGWRAHLDEQSAVDYVLHAELLKQQDAFLSSTYLHLRKDGMLAMGPVWDHDLSAGNTVAPAISAPEGWLLTGRNWASALLDDPGFRSALAERWRVQRPPAWSRGCCATWTATPAPCADRRGATSRAGRRSTRPCSATSPCTARMTRRWRR